MKTTCWCNNPVDNHVHIYTPGGTPTATTAQWYYLATFLYKLGITVIY